MTQEEFKKFILEEVNTYQDKRSLGQKVYRCINIHYGNKVVYDVLYKDLVDCFYNDDAVDEFIEKAYNRINEQTI